MDFEKILDFSISGGGDCQTVALSTTSAQSAQLDAGIYLLALDTAAFVRQGVSPTALSNGTDQYIPAGVYRIRVTEGNKLAIILGAGTGNAYLAPGV